MDCSVPGLPALHYLPEFAQIHLHWVDDAIQPSHPLSSPSPPALNLSQHQGLFQWSGSCIRWPKYWSFSFSISPSNEHSGLISLVWSPCSPRDSQESSPAPQFKSINSSAFSLLYGPTFTSIHDYWKNHSFDYTTFMAKWCLCFLIYCPGCVIGFLVSISNSSVQGNMGMKSLEYTIKTNHTDAGLWRMWSSKNGKYF